MEAVPTVHERKQLNQDIDTAYRGAAESETNFWVKLQTGRGYPYIELYERFYSAFRFLVVLTKYLKQLEQNQDEVEVIFIWLNKEMNIGTDAAIKERFREGDRLYLDYSNLLNKQGVITLPSK